MSNAETRSETIPILANVNDERRSEGYVEIHLFSKSEKITQAFKKLGLFWGISALSILIPVFHFVTVPLFFSLGIYFFWRSSQSEGKTLQGTTTCPHCQAPIVIKPAELQWPLTEICQNCARVVRIERKEVV